MAPIVTPMAGGAVPSLLLCVHFPQREWTERVVELMADYAGPMDLEAAAERPARPAAKGARRRPRPGGGQASGGGGGGGGRSAGAVSAAAAAALGLLGEVRGGPF